MKASDLIPLAFVGCFVADNTLQEWFEEQEKTYVPTMKDISATVTEILQTSTTEEDRTLIQQVLMFPRFVVVGDEEEDDQNGWYIGIDSFMLPQHASMKRIIIDLRNIFIKSELFFDDDESVDVIYPSPLIIDKSRIK